MGILLFNSVDRPANALRESSLVYIIYVCRYCILSYTRRRLLTLKPQRIYIKFTAKSIEHHHWQSNGIELEKGYSI